MPCEHEIWEMDSATADGLCPLCLRAENERLREAADKAFYAMCDHRDTPDAEVFQDAIDALGMALSGDSEPLAIQYAERIEHRQ